MGNTNVGYKFNLKREFHRMFVALFVVSFVLALTLSVIAAWISREAIDSILRRFVRDAAVRAGFEKYIRFAIVAVGISAGTRVRALQEYIAAPDWNKAALTAALTQEVWVIETYRTIVGTLEGIAWLLLACIFAALIAPVILRMAKLEPPKTGDELQKPRESNSGIANVR
jgi:hypothetical protein